MHAYNDMGTLQITFLNYIVLLFVKQCNTTAIKKGSHIEEDIND